MRDPLHTLSVKHKLALLFVALCLLSYGVGGVFVSSSARRALEQEIHRRIGHEGRTAASHLGQGLDLLARRAEDFASDGYVRERVADLSGSVPRGDERVTREQLERHLRENKLPLEPIFVGLGVVDANEDLVASAGRRPESGSSDGPPRRAQSGVDPPEVGEPSTVTVHGDLIPDPADRDRFLQSVRVPLRDLTAGRRIGSLIAWIDTRAWVDASLSHLHDTDSLLEADSDTQVSAEDRSGRRIRLVPSLGTPLSTPGAPVSWDLRALPASPEGSRPSTGRMSRSYEIDANGWTVRVQVRATDAFAPVSGLQSRVFVVGLVLAALSGLLLLFPLRFLVQPLARLRDAARRIRGGEHGARVEVESSDEVGELAEAFNHMAEAVELRTSQLKSKADELEESERRLRTERDRLEVVIQSLRDALVVLDADGHPVETNAAAEPLLAELTRVESRLTSHYACSAAERRAGCASCISQGALSSRTCVLDVGDRVFEVRAAPLPTGNSERPGRVLVARDITTRIEQDEREIHQERLSVLGEVAAVMAHELNNPLTSIRMYAQMLADRLPEGSPFAEHADVILRNTDTCRRSIRDLLGYATASAPVADDVDVHAVLHDVARFVRPLAERARAQLSLDLRAKHDFISGDEIQLRQVFVNLFVNALQASTESGTHLTVRTRNDDDRMVIEIEDTGPGIPPGVLPRVFDPFFSTKPRGKGTGLGLSTARRIVELLGGHIELVESRPGRTEFRLVLPVLAATGMEAPR